MSSSPEDEPAYRKHKLETVPKRIEEHLISAMKEDAREKCHAFGQAYATCCSGRTISIAWLCRKELDAYNQCLHQFTSTKCLEERKAAFLSTGELPRLKAKKESEKSKQELGR